MAQMIRRIGTSAALVAAMIPACRSVDVAESQSDRNAVLAAAEQYRQAWLQDDTALALSVISEDVRIFLPGAPDIRGRDGARALFVEQMRTYRIPALTVHREALEIHGDRAIDVGTYDETMAPKTGAPIHASGRYLVIWRREAGGWRMLWYMLNSAEPAEASRAGS